MNTHEYVWNDQKHEFLHLSLALLDLTVEKYDNEWMNGWMNEWMDEWMNEWTSYMNDEWNEFPWDFIHFLWFSTRALLDLTVERYDNEWMNGWMNEWMDEWMNEWMNKWMNK